MIKMKDEKEEIKPEIEEITTPEPQSEEKKVLPIMRGSIVKFTGTKSYSGLDLSKYSNGEYIVKEISDDRVVIAEGANIIAAVNIRDCVKI